MIQLGPGVAAAGVGLIACQTVGSTNAEALALARAGRRGPLWITASAQSAGRGRRGRDWVSEPGNLYATLLLTDPAPPERAAQLSFVAALAVHDAIAARAPALAPIGPSTTAPASAPMAASPTRSWARAGVAASATATAAMAIDDLNMIYVPMDPIRGRSYERRVNVGLAHAAGLPAEMRRLCAAIPHCNANDGR